VITRKAIKRMTTASRAEERLLPEDLKRIIRDIEREEMRKESELEKTGGKETDV
jgi:hypothetical protein